MAKSNVEWRVGIFVLIGLALLAALVMRFSKGASIFRGTYELQLRTEDIGFVRPGAPVVMSGVRIGDVEGVALAPLERLVTLRISIGDDFPIRTNAVFMIEQVSFLGDQIISVTSGEEPARFFEDGDTAYCQPAFSVQEVIRSGQNLIGQMDQTLVTLGGAVARIDRTLLSEHTLTNVTAVVDNLRILSEQAMGTLGELNRLVSTNITPLSLSVSNIVAFSEELNLVASELRTLVSTNRSQISKGIDRVESATGRLDELLANLNEGRGLAGSILASDELDRQFSEMVNNLTLLSSNLNRFGILWKPRVERTMTPARELYPGKDPWE